MHGRYLFIVFLLIALSVSLMTIIPRATMTPDRGAEHIYVGAGERDFLGDRIAVGDINNDQRDDIVTTIIWDRGDAPADSLGADENEGAIYVFYGSVIDTLSQQTFDLKERSPNIEILGIEPGDKLITMGVGDVLGDETEDMVLGAIELLVLGTQANPDTIQHQEGEVYIIEGSSSLPEQLTIDLKDTADFNSYVKYYITGRDLGDEFGGGIITANIDDPLTKDEIIISAYSADGPNNTQEKAGEVYVFFPDLFPGGTFPITIDMATSGADSFSAVIYGVDDEDQLGATSINRSGSIYRPISMAAGDWDGDGLADLAIGSGNAEESATVDHNNGAVYVIFSGNLAAGDTIWCDRDPGTAGAPDIRFFGNDVGDHLGTAVAFVDVDDDGLDDLVIGAPIAKNTDGSVIQRGEAYIIFGDSRANLIAVPDRDLRPPPRHGSAYFNYIDILIFGEEERDHFGAYIGGGRFDSDLFADLAITARKAEPNSQYDDAGETSIFFGKSRAQWDQRPVIDLIVDRDSIAVIKLSAVADGEMAAVVFGQLDADSRADIVFGAYDAPRDDGTPLAGQMYIMQGADVWKSGTISVNETWSSNLFVTGDLLIAAGVTVTIEAGTDVFIWPYDWDAGGVDVNRVELWVDGSLQVNGTASNPVRFLAWDGNDIESTSDNDWFGIFVNDVSGSATATFDNCVIKNATNGIQTRVAITIRNSTIETCNQNGVSIAGNAQTVTIDNTVIRDLGHAGVNLLQGSTATITNGSRLEDADDHGVIVYSGATLNIDNCEIRGNDRGIYVLPGDSVSATATIDACTFKNNASGIWVDTVDDVTITNCTIDSNTVQGVYTINNADIELRENIITNSPVGVFAYGANPRILAKNVIQYNGTGIKCDNYASAIVESTTVNNNTDGVDALNGSDPILGQTSGGSSIGVNVIRFNTSFHVANFSAGVTIMAENVFWGGGGAKNPSCFPKASKIYGSVDFDPALCSPPILAVSPFDRPAATDAPGRFKLGIAYPNPFNPTTTIRFELPAQGALVRLNVYNVDGALVRTLLDGWRGGGVHELAWDGANQRGQSVASGVYFVRLEASDFGQTQKLVLVK